MHKLFFDLFILIFASVAILHIVMPRKLWNINMGLRFKNPESMQPTHFIIRMQRFVGIMFLGFAIFLFVTQGMS